MDLDYKKQGRLCFDKIRQTPDFIKRNRLWMGIFKYKWISLYTLVVAMIFSYSMFNYCRRIIDCLINPEIETSTQALRDIAFASGTNKFLLLVLLEVVIIHFAARTLHILNRTEYRLTFKDFVQAEKRMMKVMLLCALIALVAQIFLSIVLGILGLEKLKWLFMILINAYLLGLSFFDNYNEQYGISIRDSQEIIRSHLAACVMLGLLLTALIAIPVIGPIAGPILGAVAATLYAHRVGMEKSPVA